jgi:hypothetical protein
MGVGNPFNQTLSEQREKTMAQIRRYVEISRRIKDPKRRSVFQDAMCVYSESFNMRLYARDVVQAVNLTQRHGRAIQ